jgi:hypothetical protein
MDGVKLNAPVEKVPGVGVIRINVIKGRLKLRLTGTREAEDAL